ncbi:UDP-glucose 4-epimerase family protein [Marinobacter alkaliphilus]|uniref:UDP-glucose 4-epimerase family protein n=1 Tax=Marinobacter alkaliphilus TaxID=254719 RepID=UPI003D80B1E3|nr:SDR family oxidoreductase [Marinobacter alkaliphilus]
MKILLTGSTGFVGKHISTCLGQREIYDLSCAVRKPGSCAFGREIVTGDLNAATDLNSALEGVNVVIHAAARAHIMNDGAVDPLSEYRRVNVDGTLNLARQAAGAGVQRFIFVSSVKVNGELSSEQAPFYPNDTPAPEDAYGISKWEAEQGLKAIAKETGMEVVIVRPPLVYGPGVKGNFASMVKLVRKGVPLPLGSIRNKRSLVAVDNLVDFIVTCIDHPAAANQVFMVSDGEDISTSELLRELGKAMGKPARLVPVPAGLLRLGATVLGKRAVAHRVLGSLQVDISDAKALLGWKPPVSLKEGLRRCFTSENGF